jgi:hypothetical protein
MSEPFHIVHSPWCERANERIASLEAALAAMTKERDEQADLATFWHETADGESEEARKWEWVAREIALDYEVHNEEIDRDGVLAWFLAHYQPEEEK